jgi:hypothetical protein
LSDAIVPDQIQALPYRNDWVKTICNWLDMANGIQDGCF